MRKFLYSLGIVALLASCNEDFKDWADLKTNPAEDPAEVALSVLPIEGLVVDYNTVVMDDELIDVATVAVETQLENVDAQYSAKLSNQDGSASAKLPVTLNEDATKLQVNKQDLLNAAKSVFGQTGEEETAYLDVDAILLIGSGAALERNGRADFKVIIPKPEFEWEYIYGIGNGTGWARVCPLWSANMDGIYNGFIYIDGEFKFRSHEDSWDAPDWGGGADPGTLQEGGNVTDPVETGYYAITVDLSRMRYELGTKITTIGMIGSFNDWAGDVEMTYNAATGAWEGDLELAADSEVKFRANGGWDINWGGTEDNLTQGGANLAIPAGSYKVELFAFCDGKAHCLFNPK